VSPLENIFEDDPWNGHAGAYEIHVSEGVVEIRVAGLGVGIVAVSIA
jgi:hypothetical protein